MRMKLGFAALCACATLSFGHESRAQDPRDPAAAEELFRQGRAAALKKDFLTLGDASLDTWLPVDPGEHVVIVSAPGTQAVSFIARVGESERSQVDVQVGPAAADPPPKRGGHAESQASHRAAYWVGSVGALGLLTGIVAGALVLDRKHTVDQNCVDHVCNSVGYHAAQSGKTLGVVTTVGLVTGALGLGGATYLFLSAPSPAEKSSSAAYTVGIRARW